VESRRRFAAARCRFGSRGRIRTCGQPLNRRWPFHLATLERVCGARSRHSGRPHESLIGCQRTLATLDREGGLEPPFSDPESAVLAAGRLPRLRNRAQRDAFSAHFARRSQADLRAQWIRWASNPRRPGKNRVLFRLSYGSRAEALREVSRRGHKKTARGVGLGGRRAHAFNPPYTGSSCRPKPPPMEAGLSNPQRAAVLELHGRSSCKPCRFFPTNCFALRFIARSDLISRALSVSTRAY
jgi:hypothetical protein